MARKLVNCKKQKLDKKLAAIRKQPEKQAQKNLGKKLVPKSPKILIELSSEKFGATEKSN